MTYFLRIMPDDPGDARPGPCDCTVTVTKTVEVMRFPIRATGANDNDAMREAKQIAASQLGCTTEEIGW